MKSESPSSVALKRPGLTALDALRSDLLTRRFPGGSALPPSRELAQRYGIARNTLRRVLARLEEEGRIYRRGTHEWVVLERAPSDEQSTTVMGQTVAFLSSQASSALHPATIYPASGLSIEIGAMQALQQKRYYCVPVDPHQAPLDHTLQLAQAQPTGFIAFPGEEPYEDFLEHLHALQRCALPLALHGDSLDLEGVDCVVSDHAAGCRQLTEWLLRQGRRRILRVWSRRGPLHWLAQRDCGHEDACLATGLTPLPPLRVELPRNGSTSYAEMTRRNAARYTEILRPYLSGETPVDAIMGISDGCLVDIARACEALGKAPNRDVLLVGYDNYWNEAWLPAERRFTPAATVDKNNLATGRALADLLLARAAGTLPPEPHTVSVKPELVVVPATAKGVA